MQNRLPHNLYMCFCGVEGESLMMLLDMKQIQVSTGSACNSGNLSAPAALLAIGMNEEDMHSCIRFSFGGTETEEEQDNEFIKLYRKPERKRQSADFPLYFPLFAFHLRNFVFPVQQTYTKTISHFLCRKMRKLYHKEL